MTQVEARIETDVMGRVNGSDDVELSARLGLSIRAAMGDHMRQPELARLTGIDQPTISKLIRGTRKTPLTIWEMLAIEEATSRPVGWIMQHAGLTVAAPTIVEAIQSDGRLTMESQRIMFGVLAACLAPIDKQVEAAHTRAVAAVLRALRKAPAKRV